GKTYSADPNGRGLRELGLDSRQRVIFGIHPDLSPKQVDFLPPWNDIDHISNPAIEKSRIAYVIDVVPRRQEVYLFRGKIWVDAEDYALARIEAQLAKTPSIWIRTVSFTLEFRKSGDYWFPWSSTSTSDVRVFGPTNVNIRFLDYSPLSASAGKHAGLSPMEASYAQH